jgi:hypothetical protein
MIPKPIRSSATVVQITPKPAGNGVRFDARTTA